MPVRVVGLDGDDTLWHSETRFHVTQQEFHDLIARHVPGADVDARLAATEMANLSMYGYGVKSFTLSMLETAIEMTEGRISARDLDVILGWGKRMLMQPIELLDGVEDTLAALEGDYRLLVITKGDLFDQESKLARSGLVHFFDGIDIVSEKSVDTYRGVFERRAVPPEQFVMVGNSLRSDVLPVVEAGGRAVYIPYTVTWSHETVDEERMPKDGWRRLDSIRNLPALLQTLDGRD
jgi:putative hydrolase of the HAD superfamily